ncbi:MAG: energy-coupling factor transporter ATPase [Mogibacterium sp.]|nr:energy-coupling factor transporter ATPase [Mogibacterium sp.]
MSIEVKNLRYVYNPGLPDETTALDGVSFEVDDNEILGIIGHTGSGKSTLLQHLNGLLKPASGDVYVDGQCITDGKTKLVEIRRRVGLVFQYPEYQLFEETVAKDVAFGPHNLGLDEDEITKRVRDSLEIVGLDYEEIKDSSPFELSGGQKRRVAIAGVLAMNPSVLILDEPTAGLDPTAHREVLAMIRRIHREMGMIIIFVSHNMADIADMSDYVIVMDHGRIALEGTPEEVFSYANTLASMGLAVPPAKEIMNQITAEIPEIRSSALTIEQAAEEIKKYQKETGKC